MGVFVEGVAMADTFRAEEDRVEEVLVGGVTVAEGFSGVEEEWDVDVFLSTVFAEPEDLREEFFVAAAEVFLSD